MCSLWSQSLADPKKYPFWFSKNELEGCFTPKASFWSTMPQHRALELVQWWSSHDEIPAPSLNIASYGRMVFCTNTDPVAQAQTCWAQLEEVTAAKPATATTSHLFNLTEQMGTSHIIFYTPSTLAFWPNPSTWGWEVKVLLKHIHENHCYS